MHDPIWRQIFMIFLILLNLTYWQLIGQISMVLQICQVLLAWPLDKPAILDWPAQLDLDLQSEHISTWSLNLVPQLGPSTESLNCVPQLCPSTWGPSAWSFNLVPQLSPSTGSHGYHEDEEYHENEEYHEVYHDDEEYHEDEEGAPSMKITMRKKNLTFTWPTDQLLTFTLTDNLALQRGKFIRSFWSC